MNLVLSILEKEKFEYPKSLALEESKTKFKEILEEYFQGKLEFNAACFKIESEVKTPFDYKKIKNWGERLLRTESSKLFTLGYGDYLLSKDETTCFIPNHNLGEEADCLRIIVGKEFLIKEIQDNIYKNYSLENARFPTVPLHANCRHIISSVNTK